MNNLMTGSLLGAFLMIVSAQAALKDGRFEQALSTSTNLWPSEEMPPDP